MISQHSIFLAKRLKAEKDNMPVWFIMNPQKDELALVMHNPMGDVNDKNNTQVHKISLVKPGLTDSDLKKLGVKDDLIEKYKKDGGCVNTTNFNTEQLKLLQLSSIKIASSNRKDFAIRLQEYVNNCSMVINGEPKGLEIKYQISLEKNVPSK